MSFLHPGLFVAAASAIALPILIHILLRRRRKPVMWGAMRFLLEAYQQQRRKIQFEQFLILLIRCLLIAALGAAIARPFVADRAAARSGKARTLYLLVDDSLASSARGAGGQSTLERAQQQAAELLKSLDASRGDRAALITLSAPAEGRVVPPSADPGAVLRQTMALAPTAAAPDWNQAMLLLAEAMAAPTGSRIESSAEVVLLTGGRVGSIDSRRALVRPPALTAAEFWAPPPEPQSLDNVSITDLAPISAVLTAPSSAAEPVTVGQVRVTLHRSGSLPAATTRLRLEIPSREVATKDRSSEQPVKWTAGETDRIVTMNGPHLKSADLADHPALIASIDRDAIDADNTFIAPLIARESVHVGLVAARAESRILAGGSIGSADEFSPADWIWIGLDPGAASASLTERGGDMQRSWIDPAALGATMLSEFDALVVTSPERLDRDAWRRLRQYADAGGVLVLTPASAATTQTWTDGFAEAFSPNFAFAREVRSLDSPAPLAFDPAVRPAWDPLKGLSSEAAELIKPVAVRKLLTVTSTAVKAAPDNPILSATVAGRTLPLVVQITSQDDKPTRGVSMLVTAALTPAWTDLPTRPFFLPLLHELIRSGIAHASAESKQIAGRRLRAPGGAVALRLGKSTQTLAVDSTGHTTDSVRLADLASAVDARGAVIATVGVNPDTSAADVTPQDRAALSSYFAPLLENAPLNFLDGAAAPGSDPLPAAQGELPQNPSSLWSLWLFALAGALALLELVLGKKFSHAQPSAFASALDVKTTAASFTERAA